ncbi:MAG TPA: hypothetical protein PLS70_19550, partial [Acidobacteriota bacterium]|nr:hypothetical protein [Acidobacteriota bacterium]
GLPAFHPVPVPGSVGRMLAFPEESFSEKLSIGVLRSSLRILLTFLRRIAAQYAIRNVNRTWCFGGEKSILLKKNLSPVFLHS